MIKKHIRVWMRRLHKFVEFRAVAFLGIICQLRSFVEEIPHSRRVGAVEPGIFEIGKELSLSRLVER